MSCNSFPSRDIATRGPPPTPTLHLPNGAPHPIPFLGAPTSNHNPEMFLAITTAPHRKNRPHPHPKSQKIKNRHRDFSQLHALLAILASVSSPLVGERLKQAEVRKVFLNRQRLCCWELRTSPMMLTTDDADRFYSELCRLVDQMPNFELMARAARNMIG